MNTPRNCLARHVRSGAPGSGKRQLLKAVAAHLSVHVFDVDVNHLVEDTPASTESKLKQELTRAAVYAPCVIGISNVEVLIKDASGNGRRLSRAVQDGLADAQKHSHPWPIVAVCFTDDEERVLADNDYGALFLQHLHLNSLTDAERVHVLHFFASEIDNTVNLKLVAKQTGGFVVGDFFNLLLSARSIHVQANENVIAHNEYLLSHSDIAQALSRMLKNQAQAIGAPQIPSVRWEDIGGLAAAKNEILDTIQLPIEHPELTASGLKRSGLLLYGPPGTGKTLLAKAVATECCLNFLSVKGPELINMYVGQSEQNVRDVFKRAREALPCVIFFDELDSLAPNRGNKSESGGVMDRVVSQLLVEMDGINKSPQLFIIGATNRPDLVDPALLRPGRFDRLVYVSVPDDTDSRLKILQALTRKFTLADGVSLEQVEQQCPRNLTGADFYSLCSSAMMSAVGRVIGLIESKTARESDVTSIALTLDDFSAAIKHFHPSVSAQELQRYQLINKNMTT